MTYALACHWASQLFSSDRVEVDVLLMSLAGLPMNLQFVSV